MGIDLVESFLEAKSVFETVSAVVGRDLVSLCRDSDEDTLRQTQNAQIALFTTSVAAYRSLESKGVSADVFAGHSIGEYAALVCSGTLSLEDGARLVALRGKLMAEAGTVALGTMAAVLGLEIDAIKIALSNVKSGIVVVANDNCPGQVVISGEIVAVEEAGPILLEAGAKRVLPLNVSGAFHSPLMETPSEQLSEALLGVIFSNGKPVYSNVTTQTVSDAAEWKSLLTQQLKDSVRWTGSVQNMVSDGVNEFVECGVGEVLLGMLKRIDKSVSGRAVFDSASISSFLERN
jgi:[acyl-carrier-protein] S-malonyltransferase